MSLYLMAQFFKLLEKIVISLITVNLTTMTSKDFPVKTVVV